jgi:multiple sugar transport system ATP-binding protein
MKKGVVQQIDEPQKVYDEPVNLFVAKFLGTPPINVFTGKIENCSLYIGEEVVAKFNAPDQEVYVAIRPEGFNVDPKGPFSAHMKSIEVMGRDSSIVSTHPAAETPIIRSIIASDTKVEADAEGKVHFTIKPYKMFVFNRETENRVYSDEVK